MKLLFKDLATGSVTYKNTCFIPDVGNNLELFYNVLSRVESVLLWPSSKTVGDMLNCSNPHHHGIDGIVYTTHKSIK